MMGSMANAYRCPVCGEDLTVETEPTSRDPLPSSTTFGVTTTIRHPAPMDAACRWAFDAFADEQRRIMDETLRRTRDQMFDTL